MMKKFTKPTERVTGAFSRIFYIQNRGTAARQDSRRMGFTLTELIVVLAIMGILAAAGILSAARYIKLAEFRENEANAKTAYLAAESVLTWYRTSGEWEAFRKQVEQKGTQNETFGEDDPRNGRIYGIMLNSSAASDSKELVAQLLDGGTYDKSFFGGSIALEIDVETGHVYSAFYATRCGGLTYGAAAETDRDKTVQDITAAGDNRAYENRRERLLGYYSTEDLANVVELKPIRLKTTTINLVNGETLSLNWTSNSRYDNLDVKFKIDFYTKDSGGDTLLFSTEIDRYELREKGEDGRSASLVLRDQDGKPIGGDTKEWTFPLTYQASEGRSGRFSLTLDGMMTAELMGVIEAKSGGAAGGDAVERAYSTSVTRLGDDIPALKTPQDIYAQIEVTPTYRQTGGNFMEYTSGGVVRSNVENTLYAACKTEDGDVLEAKISRFRHLSNIRYYPSDKTAVFTLADGTLDWASAGVGMYGLGTAEDGGASGVPSAGAGGGTEAGVEEGIKILEWKGVLQEDGSMLDFPSIRLLSKKHTLEGKGNGTAAQLSNLRLGVSSMPNDMLVGKWYAGSVNESQYTSYLGLFCEAEGSIRNLTFKNPVLVLTGRNQAGKETAAEGFDRLYGVGIVCGRSSGTLENVAVRTTEKDRRTVTVWLKSRETAGLADDRKPAGIGGLVGVFADRESTDTADQLKPLQDGKKARLHGLVMEGTVTGTLPVPAEKAAVTDLETESGSDSGDSSQTRAWNYRYGIGGIFGYGWLEDGPVFGSPDQNHVKISDCENHAKVTGNLFTGGIGGYLTGNWAPSPADKDSLTRAAAAEENGRESMTGCFGDGLVLCSVKPAGQAPGGMQAEPEETGDRVLEGKYFGGILGFGRKVRITDCESASGRAVNYRYTYKEKDEVLLGQYVGGIIGYGSDSQLAGCSTGKDGYILGSDYVGGIAGGLSNDAKQAITGSSGIAVTTNAGYVIGNSYVGGIVGKNDGSKDTIVTNCVNNGVAAGYRRYIGGIVGYNGEKGTIRDCASYLSDYSGAVFHTIVNDWKASGDCAGGLAGYNNGRIHFTAESEEINVKAVSSIVVGSDYVGGVVGFNDRKGELDVHYTLIGGRIHGFGNAVGGCIGLNASEGLLKKQLSIRPVSVNGGYYVGGCIGANMVDLSGDTVMEKFRSDNALGSITGKAFTGGVIGYQRTYTGTQLAEAMGKAGLKEDASLLAYLDLFREEKAETGIMAAVQDGIRLGISAGTEQEAAAGAKPGARAAAGTKKGPGEGILPLLPVLGEGNIPTAVMPSANPRLLTIANTMKKADGTTPADNNNISVTADLYLGGVVGYCERNSRLVMRNCINSGNLSKLSGSDTGTGAGVLLTAYLQSSEVGADIGGLIGLENLRLSIGGGIIGANLDHQIIDSCQNTGAMNGFVGLGGIVGFNAGGVFNCTLSGNFGNAGLDYLGGIAGLNIRAGRQGVGDGGNTGTIYKDVNGKEWSTASGIIAACDTQAGRTVSGRSFVGGIAGYNMPGALLESNVNRANVTAAGDYAGGVAGRNDGLLTLAAAEELFGDDGQSKAAYTVAGEAGTGIGGIAGWNGPAGAISVTAAAGAEEVTAVGTGVTVVGRDRVGGVVGLHEGSLTVRSGDGAGNSNGSGAGTGVTGYLACRASLVQASEGYAGGIAGEATGTVAQEGTGQDQEAQAQGAGRIVRAVNRAEKVTALRGPAGGIVAVNGRGFLLQDCENIGDVNSDQGYAGGIAAENYGLMNGCTVGAAEGEDGNSDRKTTEISSRGEEAVGGVCAVNHGTVKDCGIRPGGDVRLSGTAEVAGGIAGINRAGGLIIGQPPREDEKAPEASDRMPALNLTAGPLTVGGAAGRNESGQGTLEAAGIRDVTFHGLAFENIPNIRYLGGIVGENQEGASAKNCRFQAGRIVDSGGTGGSCYGGIAGQNAGTLDDCEISGITINITGVYTATSTSTAAEKERLATHVGGIAGKNEESGRIKGCVAAAGTAAADASVISAENGMAGGIAGYNKGHILLSGDSIMTEKLREKGGSFGGDGENEGGGGIRDLAAVLEAGVKESWADSSYVSFGDGASALETFCYADKNKSLVTKGRTLTLTMTANGNLGGITAYNGPAGVVEHCATGNWYLNNKSAAIGVGTGGMIGMNESECSLSFLVNRAFVGREFPGAGDTNRFAGGIIGNQNNTTTGGWTIENCVNYGTVYCLRTHYSGGILGQWTGTGGTIRQCYNYGNLQTTYQTGWLGASGGIVAQLYHAYENHEYNIISCGNYGNIYGRTGASYGTGNGDCANDSAGILGNVTAYRTDQQGGGQKFTIQVLDCVNGAGVEIYSASMASGIVGFFSCDNPDTASIENSTSNITLRIERCRNYAFKLQGKTFVGGIFGERYSRKGSANTTLKYCFSVNRGGWNYSQAPRPIVSFKSSGSQHVEWLNSPDGIKKDKNIYNYFLSDDGIISFCQANNTISVNSPVGNDYSRANARWVYSFEKNGSRYFIILGQDGSYDVKDLLIDGETVLYKDWKGQQTEVGKVLFKTPNTNTYDSLSDIVSKGSDFDTYVRTFCYTAAGMLLAPEKVTLEREGNQLTVCVVSADSASVTYEAQLYRKNADGTKSLVRVNGSEDPVPFSASPFTFSVSDEEMAKKGEVFVEVKAKDKDGILSEPVKSNLVSLEDLLPDPQLRITLVKTGATGAGGSTYAYRFTLDNPTAYDGMKNVWITVKPLIGNELIFDSEGKDKDGKDAAMDAAAAGALQQLVVRADQREGGTASGKILQSSAELSVPVSLPAYVPEISVKGVGGKVLANPAVALSGTSLQDLTIRVDLTGNGTDQDGKSVNVTTPPIYRAELIGTWKNPGGSGYTGKADTVIQQADILTTANGTASAVFSNLPEYIAEVTDLRIRVWYAQSGLGPVYTYEERESEAGANIKMLTVETETAADGSTVCKETWEYAYSPVLEDAGTKGVFASYVWNSDETSAAPLLKWLPRPKPEDAASLAPEENPADGHLWYTFKWDQGPGEYQSGYEYIVTLTGINRDENGDIIGSPVSIVTGEEVKGNTYKADGESWTYDEVTLTLTRKGNNGGSPKEIGLSSEKTYAVKKRLPKPAQLRVSNPDVNELRYVAEWDPIHPETGCEAYQIYLRPYRADGTLDAAVLIARAEVSEKQNGVYQKEIDLEAYADKRLLIYVKALASAGDGKYADSVDGITYELAVPRRIQEPVITQWIRSWEYDKNNPVSVESFSDGDLKVSVQPDSNSIPPGGSSYLVKGYVFDQTAFCGADGAFDKAKAEAVKTAVENGAVDGVDGLLAVYPGVDGQNRLEPVEMDGESGGTYGHKLAGLPARYAGKYILFYTRISSGDGNVSSAWVENTDLGTMTDIGGIWRLPFVQLSKPEVTVDSEEQDVELTLIPNPDLPDQSSKSLWAANHTTLTWDSVEYGDVFETALTVKGDGTDVSVPADEQWRFRFMEDRNSGKVTVFGRKGETDSWEELCTIEDGENGFGTVLRLEAYQYHLEGQYEKETGRRMLFSVDLTAAVRVDRQGDGFRYTLFLPDVVSLEPKEETGNSIGEQRFTRRAAIHSNVKENIDGPSDSDAYVASEDREVTFH